MFSDLLNEVFNVHSHIACREHSLILSWKEDVPVKIQQFYVIRDEITKCLLF